MSFILLLLLGFEFTNSINKKLLKLTEADHHITSA